jgi:hypothetical protein
MASELGASIGRFGLTAAGGLAFGPIGAAAGALLGGFLFGSSGPDIEGPRLGDLDVSSSTYGGVIPVGFGVQKVAGTMIWATDIEEEKRTRTEDEGIFGWGGFPPCHRLPPPETASHSPVPGSRRPMPDAELVAMIRDLLRPRPVPPRLPEDLAPRRHPYLQTASPAPDRTRSGPTPGPGRPPCGAFGYNHRSPRSPLARPLTPGLVARRVIVFHPSQTGERLSAQGLLESARVLKHAGPGAVRRRSADRQG